MSSLPETLSGSDAYAQIPQHNHLAARTILDHSNGELTMVMPMWGTLGHIGHVNVAGFLSRG